MSSNREVSSSSFKFYYKYIITSILQSLEYEKYDVPQLAVSYSYSKQEVVRCIKLSIILQCMKITYWTKYEVGIR